MNTRDTSNDSNEYILNSSIVNFSFGDLTILNFAVYGTCDFK